ncbi:MAG: TetR/AcrR family transcriptional regulator [Aeromicrobium sp.]|uniref:TetR/AcrR family transcriptional regulator n=1 Tax=Aeromicrobium sp. TaxID=1871063 RepID=UPI0039E61B98
MADSPAPLQAEPTRRHRSVTRGRLLDAARDLLAREGLKGITVARLCAEAGFTRGAFYSNFDSMDALVRALVDRERERMLALVREAADPSVFAGLEPAEAAAAVLERFALLQPPDREWFLLHLEFEMRGLRGDLGGEEFVEWWHRIVDGIAEVVEAALDLTGLRLVVESREAVLILMGTWDALVLSSLVEERDFDLDLLRRTLPRILVSLTEPL